MPYPHPVLLLCAALLMPACTAPRGGELRNTLISVSDNVRVEHWRTDQQRSGVGGAPWSVTKRTLHGGRQEGVDLIEVDNGVLRFTVIPTRGMSIGQVVAGDVRLGWDSPVREVVHPRHIDLQDHAGLGWLTGFNEWLTRCGVAFAGHPGEDNERLLTLHGRIGNIPASEVEVVIDTAPPHRIRVRSRVDEQMFKFADFELWTEVSTVPGSDALRIEDRLVNRSSYKREYQVIYHTNFGPPLLEAGARFVAPADMIAPFDAYAAKDLDSWRAYLGPTRDYGEQVYCVTPHDDGSGRTLVMLRNAAADRGVAIRYRTDTLPKFTLWKNTDTAEEGYVTGLEPGTGFPYNRSVERSAGRVPTLGPGAEVTFALDYRVLRDAATVEATRVEIEKIQGYRGTKVSRTPPRN